MTNIIHRSKPNRLPPRAKAHPNRRDAARRAGQRIGAILGAAIAACSFAARAAETPIPVTPPGATDINQAILPPFPGLYGGLVALPYDRNTALYDSSGHAIPSSRGLRVDIQIVVPALLYIYPFTVFGGTVGSTFIQPIGRLHYTIADHYTKTQIGLSDAYSDLFFWSKNVGLMGATPGQAPMPYGLTVGAGLALIIPDGKYDARIPLNEGGNVWVIDPNFALTYNTGPRLSFGDNTQFSARVFYGIPFENPATHYASGDVIDVDFSTSQQFGRWRIGAAGYFETQTTADRPPGGAQLPNGNRFTAVGMGPVAEYVIPEWNASIKAKFQDTFVHKNFVDEQFGVVTFGIKF